MFRKDFILTPTDFCEQANILGPREISYNSLRPSNRLLPRLKIILALEHWTTGGSTKRMGNLSSAFEKAFSQREQIFKCRLVSWQRTPVNIIYPNIFHLNHIEIAKTQLIKGCLGPFESVEFRTTSKRYHLVYECKSWSK